MQGEALITQQELFSIFPDGIPIPVMKMIFPEKSGKMTVDDIRFILTAMKTEAAPAVENPGKLLAQVASIICEETCGLTSECKSREAAKALYEQGYLSSHVQDEAGWQPIETAPKDKTPIIIAVPTKDRDDWIVGEGYFDPDHYEGGDWWWANLGYGDYHAGPISECNHWPPELWQPLPVPAAAPAKQEG